MTQNLSPVASAALIDDAVQARQARNAPLVVTSWNKSPHGSSTRVSAQVDGFEVYFEGDCLADAPERADAFLAVALIQAMYQNRTLDLRALPPLSSGLLANMQVMQDIWCCWNPRLHRIDILATETPTPAGSTNLTFFSGGVDAVHSAMTLGERAGRLVFINGFDFDMNSKEFDGTFQRSARIAELLGKELVVVRTNWITYTRKLRIARSTSHGSCLAAVAHLLNPREAFIASSHSWMGMHPSGSHTFLDKLWGSDDMKVHHHGKDVTRLEKIAAIAQRPELLQHLWVCHEHPTHNCGRCSKCARTHAMLIIVGGDTSMFPARNDDIVKRWLLDDASNFSEMPFRAEVAFIAREMGRQDLLKIIDDAERKALRRSVFRRLWRRLLPGLAAKRDAATDLLPWGSGPKPQ